MLTFAGRDGFPLGAREALLCRAAVVVVSCACRLQANGLPVSTFCSARGVSYGMPVVLYVPGFVQIVR